MSLGKIARKLKRVGKSAVQFRFVSTFEYIDLSFNGSWRPDTLRVVWLRNHRKVKSTDVKWVPTEDRGPNGADGKAVFNPIISVALLVTLYRDSGQVEFQEKEYKYYIENYGPNGKKTLASFHCDMSEYTGVPSAEHTLAMSFKPVSVKVTKAVLGITLKSEFIKQGSAVDDDMQSTFSAMSAGTDLSYRDDEDEELDLDEEPIDRKLSVVQEGDEGSGQFTASLKSVLVLGTGETLRRNALPLDAPPKPTRGASVRSSVHPVDSDSPAVEHRPVENQSTGGTLLSLPPTVTVSDAGETLATEAQSATPSSSNAPPTVTPTSDNSRVRPECQASNQTIEHKSMPTSNGITNGGNKEEEPTPSASEGGNKKEEPTPSASEGGYKKEEPTPSTSEGGYKKEEPTPSASEGGNKKEEPTPSASEGGYKKEEPTPSASEGDKKERKPTPSASEGGNKKGEPTPSASKRGYKKEKPTPSASEGGNKKEEPTSSTSEGDKKERKSTPTREEPKQTDKSELGGVREGSPSLVKPKITPRNQVKGQVEVEVPVGGEVKQNELPPEPQCSSAQLNGPESRNPDNKSHDKTQVNGEQDDKSHDKAQVNSKQDDKSHDKTQVNGKQDNRSHDKAQVNNETDKKSPDCMQKKSEPVDGEVTTKTEERKQMSDFISSGGGGGYDPVFEAAMSLVQLRTASESANDPPVRIEIQSQDEYHPPSNPYLEEEQEIEESVEPSPTAAWLVETATFVDCFGESVGREKLDRVEIIALYFSASWCPPCRKFLPKLVKFYHYVKQNGKSFEVLYISSDYSKQEMMKYMQQQQMPWVGLAFEGKVANSLQKMFGVSAIPQLKIVTTKGELIEEGAKKLVETTSSGADVLRLYNKWHEKLEPSESAKEKEQLEVVKKPTSTPRKSLKSRSGTTDSVDSKSYSSKEDSASQASPRLVVERNHSRSRQSSSSRNKSKDALLDEKDDRIRRLEEINMSLKQTNDELSEELSELKRQMTECQAKMSEMEKSSRQLEEDKKETIAKLSTRGWLYKKGIKGPTANIWRRRYFRCDQGSKICYYKSAAEGTPQGFIDLAKLISVQEVSPAHQDKNHATFLVQCDGRTYQLQAYDEATMRKWMSAIEYLGRWHKTNSLQKGATP